MIVGHPGIDRISRMLDGMLDPRHQAKLEKHLSTCGSCREKQGALARVRSALKSLPPIAENLFTEPLAPELVVPRAPTFQKGIGVGILVGVVLVTFITLHQVQPALRVISSSPDVVSVPNGVLGNRVLPDATIRTMDAGHVDLELPDQVLLRLKPGTTITWQQVNRHWLSPRPHIVVNLARGELVGRTKESFWGSSLEVRTPAATTTVKGTAFALKVDPNQDATTVEVLAGSVFFSPHLGNVGVDVPAGKMSRIRSQRLPSLPKSLSGPQRQALLEAYRIGQDPQIALVIGGGPERSQELLQPALLYLSNRSDPQVQPYLRKAIQELNTAILEGDLASHKEALKILEMGLPYLNDQKIIVPLRLFAGALSLQMHSAAWAQIHLRVVIDDFPKDRLASVALAAHGMISGKAQADEDFKTILARYPSSPEATWARNHTSFHPPGDVIN